MPLENQLKLPLTLQMNQLKECLYPLHFFKGHASVDILKDEGIKR
jgi:hypothetical protein